MRDVSALCALIRRRVGIDLQEARTVGSLRRFVDARVSALELRSTSNYLELLQHQKAGGDELARVIKAITNPHTFFFRDETQFRAVRTLISDQGQDSAEPVMLWSAGCATGEEAYTLAMICADLEQDVRIVATDVNKDSLEIAQRALYKAWSLRRCPPSCIKRYFIRDDDETYRVSESIRAMVTFRLHNLVDDPVRPLFGPKHWALILCRNVLLYFHRPIARVVLEGFTRVLRPGGWLFLSSAEHLHGLLNNFELVEVGGTFGYHLLPPSNTPSQGGQWTTSPRHELTPAPAVRAGASFPLSDKSRQEEVPAALDGKGNGGDTIVDLYERALNVLNKGDRSAAMSLLKRYVDGAPDHVLAWISLGNLHLKAHEFDEALSAYENARGRAPLLPEIHYLQGVVYRKLGNLTRSIHAFRQALFLNPRFWCAAFMLAGVYGRAGRMRQRRRSLQHTLSLLESERHDQFFESYVDGMQDACIPPDETMRLCKRYLKEPMA